MNSTSRSEVPPGHRRNAVWRTLQFIMQNVFAFWLEYRVRGLENLPERGPFVLAPNHVSYLDSFALAAALDDGRLRETYWAGWVGLLFQGPLTRLFSRVFQILPVDPERGLTSTLALGRAEQCRASGSRAKGR